MKKNIRLMLTLALALSVSVMSCKKTDKTDTGDKNSELSTHSDDQSRVSSETDAVANDANNAIDGYAVFNGRHSNISFLPCDAIAHLDSTSTARTITITYNGVSCSGNHKRVGVVVLSMPLNTHWIDAGAVLTVDIQNLKITRLSDNKSITLNGISTVKNETGGSIFDLSNGTTITHSIQSSSMSITFDDNSQRTWQIARKRVFSYDNGIVITISGTHTDGTITGISEWGTTRYGTPFVTSITQPFVIRQDCLFRIVGGQFKHQRLAAEVVCTFGLDAEGNPATSCPTGFYYFKMVWTGTNGAVVTLIYPY